MDKPNAGPGFTLMALEFKIRDWLKPRIKVLRDAGIPAGAGVLDFGCGPGSYIRPLAALVGPAGKIYALDVVPQALKYVGRIVKKHGLKNVITIQSDSATGLPDASLDYVLLYDVLHDLEKREKVLAEFRRVLKDGGVLSVTDHHLTEGQIVNTVTTAGWFRLEKKGEIVYNFKVVKG